jgi:hypothetical protein
MNRTLTLGLAALTLVGATALATYSIAMQEPAGAPTPAQQQEMMMAMMQAGTPGKEHEELMKSAGDWSVKTKYRMSPDQPWSEGTATAKMSKALGGRFVAMKYSGKMSFGPGMEMTLDGLEIFGFNNLTQEYEAYWFDSMSTWGLFSSGKEENGVLNLLGTIVDPITPQGRAVRFTKHKVDEDHFVAEAFDTIPPLGEVKVMEMEFTRVQN